MTEFLTTFMVERTKAAPGRLFHGAGTLSMNAPPASLAHLGEQEFHLVRQDMAVLQNEMFKPVGLIRQVQQFQVGFRQHPVGLPVVAMAARRNHVGPHVLASFGHRMHVVPRKVPVLEVFTAVRANVPVPLE